MVLSGSMNLIDFIIMLINQYVWATEWVVTSRFNWKEMVNYLKSELNHSILQGVWSTYVGYWGKKYDKLEAGSAVIDFYRGSDVMSGL